MCPDGTGVGAILRTRHASGPCGVRRVDVHRDPVRVLRAWLFAVWIAFAFALTSCASGSGGGRGAQVPSATLVGESGESGESMDVRVLARQAPLTVLVFFSPGCRCLCQHEPRLRDIYRAFRPRGAKLLMVDSEVRGSLERDALEACDHGYPFPIVLDRCAEFADALGAKYASYPVVIDRSGRVRYRGGIDSDETHLHDDAAFYLRDAMVDLLAGREPRVSSGKTLGCSLQKW
ncbi:MAG: redoxin domain-containing protein [Polyangiaceae bacterium]